MKSTLIVATVLAAALVGTSTIPAYAVKNTGSHIDARSEAAGAAPYRNARLQLTNS